MHSSLDKEAELTEILSCYTDIIQQEEEESAVKKAKYNGIKMDIAWKTVLRGIRACLKESMDASLMFQGRQYWEDSKLFSLTRRLLQ